MSSFRACRTWLFVICAACPGIGLAQSISAEGSNYPIVAPSVGDQVFPSMGLWSGGGYVAWQDNAVDIDGFGIMARRLDGNLSGVFGGFQVNQLTAGDQKVPVVVAFPDGGAAIAWQGGESGFENIYIRLLRADGTFAAATETQVNVFTGGSQTRPRMVRLTGGNVAIAWNSLNQDGSMLGVYARVMAPTGEFLTDPFRVNQNVAFNQRDVDIAALTGGGFVAVWIGESQAIVPHPRVHHQTHVFARLYQGTGEPVTDEFRVDGTALVCANPAVAGDPSGGFFVVWSNKDLDKHNSWDVAGRRVRADGLPLGGDLRVNEFQYGDQYAPTIAAVGGNQLVTWSSMGQDGSLEGVFARLFVEGQKVGAELAVNTQTGGRQIQPSVAGDGANRFLIAWANFIWETGFDIVAQRYSSTQALPRMAPPWLSALSEERVMVTWPELAGYPVVHYNLHIDGGSPIVVAGNSYTASGFGAATVHSFRVSYVLPGNQAGPVSDPATARTWDEDLNGDGLPDDWQELYWGDNKELWGIGSEDSDGDGATNFQEFLAGTDPNNPQSVLRMWMGATETGPVLRWSTRPGFIYQVQSALDLRNWSNAGPPRLAAGVTDAMAVTGLTPVGYYRVVRVR